MIKTIGWVLIAILNFVLMVLSIFSIMDDINSNKSPWVSGILCIWFFVWTIIWILNARDEWKEYQEWLKDE